MKTYKHTFIFLTLVCMASCNNAPENKSEVNTNSKNTVKAVEGYKISEESVKTYMIDGRNDSLIEVQHEDFDEEQPFINDCKANFHRFGERIFNNGICNIYYSGKGWNSELYSCSYIWGELVNNEFPFDTMANAKNLVIHLLDLNEFFFPTDGSIYGNDTVKKYVIAVYYREKDSCIYDPYKTGKYQKSKWWQE